MYKIYQVKPGDTLESIAKMFNMSISKLMEFNGVDEAIVGMPLVVLNNNNNKWYENYIVKSGDTLYSIALANNISLSDLIAINGLDKDSYIYPNQEIIIPNNNYKIYVTKPGDKLMDILKIMNTNISKLIDNNPEIILEEDQLLINKY